MKSVTTSTEVVLYNIGDVHRGDEACDVSLFHKVIEKVKKQDNALWVSTGDLLNVSLKDSKSDVYSSSSLQAEMDNLVIDLSPIADKCVGICSSNHHNRFDRAVGMSLDKLICKSLNATFLGDCGALVITCGRMSHWIAMHHTTGGGGTMGAKANKQERLMNLLPGYNLYLTGHTHTYMVTLGQQTMPDRKRGRLTTLSQMKCTTGHFLEYSKSYAPSLMLPEMPKGAAAILLQHSNSGKEAHKTYTAWLEN